MTWLAVNRVTALAAVMTAPLMLGGCAYPTYRYYSAPCAPTTAPAAANAPKQQVVPGSDGKQCMYAAPDYAAGPPPYAYGYGYGYGSGSTYDAFDDGWDFGFGYPYWAGGWGLGGLHGAYGYRGGWHGYGRHGGWGGLHGGWGNFHGGEGGFHGGGGRGHGR